MLDLLGRLRTRVVPALLTALGVMLVTAGLLTYTDPGTAAPPTDESPTAIALPSDSPSASAASPSASAAATPSVTPSGSASASLSPSASPSNRVATRIVIPALRIDLPVVKGPSGYPLCNVAMYLSDLGQPGGEESTYLYAHARPGMFLPLLESSKVGNGATMLKMQVQVYTSDDQLFFYEVKEIRRHARTLDDAFTDRNGDLWLQTSEGPNSTYPKLQLIAKPLSSGPADHDAAHPKAKPVKCD